ncbi:DUF3021 domain-containing protein [Staphylococcus gallinarum]|uniref:DUF3021 domain-containing protein n=1 Tax=Staphylococcus gallinarum TaxID=1293 RepID=UPI001E4499D4|nr:DUF3021 domain-containing protein [Staphylococcus gallinarum]MCD8785696.1 DUF3021 domain-containing protein [Staphylococcus gallinarum]MCD8828999.1 DUF3021 domain-containing protein [Staphylococcus gallinarum]MCD8858406.1 DUF3021 domain-containing protein [Staphylococcus gallinarum]MEB6055750.1 DUF3021 domain-containing protein [Staphylococcus gallinarum]
MKKIIIEICQGIGMSSAIMLIFVAMNQMPIGLEDVIGIYIFGAICGLLSAVYNIEKLTLLFQLFIHLGGSAIAFLIVSYLNNWMPMKFSILLPSMFLFVTIFLVLWFAFLITNIQISNKVNAKLKK